MPNHSREGICSFGLPVKKMEYKLLLAVHVDLIEYADLNMFYIFELILLVNCDLIL